jgi:hypothetical protein
MRLTQQLEKLLEQVAQERVSLREIAAELEQCKIEVDNAALAIADGYANEDEKAVAKSRELQDQAGGGLRICSTVFMGQSYASHERRKPSRSSKFGMATSCWRSSWPRPRSSRVGLPAI